MKTNNVNYISKYDIRATYYGENGRIKLIPTAWSYAAWWIRRRLPYHAEGLVLYIRQVGYNLRQIEWTNAK